MATCENIVCRVCAYVRQEIHGRPHKQSLFVSEESFKIWPTELENRAWILSREWDALRPFGEESLNVPTTYYRSNLLGKWSYFCIKEKKLVLSYSFFFLNEC